MTSSFLLTTTVVLVCSLSRASVQQKPAATWYRHAGSPRTGTTQQERMGSCHRPALTGQLRECAILEAVWCSIHYLDMRQPPTTPHARSTQVGHSWAAPLNKAGDTTSVYWLQATKFRYNLLCSNRNAYETFLKTLLKDTKVNYNKWRCNSTSHTHTHKTSP